MYLLQREKSLKQQMLGGAHYKYKGVCYYFYLLKFPNNKDFK